MPTSNITFQAVKPADTNTLNKTASNTSINSLVLNQPRLQLVGSRGHLPTAEPAADTYTQGIARTFFVAPPVDISHVRILYPGFWINSTQETDCSNVFTISSALETLAPQTVKTYPFHWVGKKSFSVDAGVGLFMSDPIGITIPANAYYAVRTGVGYLATDKAMTGQVVIAGGASSVSENFRRSTEASIVYSTGSVSAGTGISGNSASIMSPAGLIGYPKTPIPAIAIFGDSIAIGSGDGSTGKPTGTYYGFYDRGMYNIDDAGGMWPHVNFAVSGASAITQTPQAFYRTYSIMEYTTHAMFALGTNDLVGQTVATTQTSLTTLWDLAKSRNNKVIATTVVPRTSGTYTSDAGQTPVSGFEAGGKRDQLNAWLYSKLADGTIDYLIDCNPYVQSPTASDKWRSTGGTARTADGVHSNTTGYTEGMEAARLILKTLTAV